MEAWVDISILGLMALTAIAIVMLRNLLAVVMLSGIYSLLAASIFVVMDAVDVAFTEAAVGAGISTMLFIGTLALTTRLEEARPYARSASHRRHNYWCGTDFRYPRCCGLWRPARTGDAGRRTLLPGKHKKACRHS